MGIRHGLLTIDDLTSPTLEAGPPDSTEAVVFVHGSPGCSDEFRHLVEESGAFTRAVAIDMPGFGRADKPSPKEFIYDVPNIGVHLAKQIEALGIERAHLVGHDFGGAFISLAATYNPMTVASMTMINSGLMRGMRWHRLARLYRTPLAGEAFMAIANEAGFRRTLKDLPEHDLDVMWQNFDRRTRRAILALYRATDMDTQTVNLPQMRLLASNWPAIVIFGADDPYLPSKFAERNKESLPNATVHLIEGAGHWPHLEKPAEVSELLIPFLREQTRAAVAA